MSSWHSEAAGSHGSIGSVCSVSTGWNFRMGIRHGSVVTVSALGRGASREEKQGEEHEFHVKKVRCRGSF